MHRLRARLSPSALVRITILLAIPLAAALLILRSQSSWESVAIGRTMVSSNGRELLLAMERCNATYRSSVDTSDVDVVALRVEARGGAHEDCQDVIRVCLAEQLGARSVVDARSGAEVAIEPGFDAEISARPADRASKSNCES
jgi:hypothetical protein